MSKLESTTPEPTKEQLSVVYAIGKNIPPVPDDLPEPKLSDNAWYIGKTRYAVRNIAGEPTETARQMFWRVAYNIAAAERLYSDQPKKDHLKYARQFYKQMVQQKFIPNTPTMLNTGKPNQQLSACFVLPVEDSLEGILQTATDMARIHKSGGGTGFSFSRLRSKDSVIATSKGKTTGPVSFMQMYNDMTSSIRQGGVRRGANMGILHYTHPDLLSFIIYKVDEFSLTNFNISVTVDDKFFSQIKKDATKLEDDYEQGFDFEKTVSEIKAALQTRDLDLKQVLLDKAVVALKEWCAEEDSDYGYNLVDPHTKKVTARLNAKKVFDLITRLAWNYGDPGMIMMDRINNSRANPTPQMGEIEATNPCGEQPLLPYDACTLGSINLAKFVKDDSFDWEALKTTTHHAIHFLDNVLDMNEYPIEKVRITTRAIRRIGLGIMGYADALLMLGVGYDTEKGFKIAEEVMKFIQKESDVASCELAKTRGVFPAFKGSIYDKPGEIKPRNGARTTIAPTGTIAMLADCSSGCEPLFALTYAKNTIEGKRMFQTSPHVVAALKEAGIYSEELLEKIQENGGSVQGMPEVPEKLQKIFVVAGDISPESHLKVQASLQKYVDNAISKTINFSNSATIKDVRNAYLLAHTTGCKGITIYRDGSREKQVLEVKKTESYYDKLSGTEVAKELAKDQAPVTLRPRPEVLTGKTYKIETPVGSAFVCINEDEDSSIFEVFINVGRAGSDITADAEALGRLISLTFRIPSSYTSDRLAQNVVSQLSGIGGGASIGFGNNRVRSLADAVAKVIREHEENKVEQANIAPVKVQVDLCPDCGNATLRFIEGCQKCENCGYSKC